MRYLITLTPLEPYLFGGDVTFGKLGDEENGTYLVHSQKFPQQSAILGMIRKEIMIQDGKLTRKVRGEWVDKDKVEETKRLVGDEKFDLLSKKEQDFGVISKISPIFLYKDEKRFIKKVDIDSYEYKDGLLKNYNPKIDIYDNFVEIDNKDSKKSASDIFKAVEQIGIKKGGGENAFFKKTSYLLNDNFSFAFYADIDYELKDSIVKLGADDSKFKMKIIKTTDNLEYEDKNGYLTLLSDTYITLPLKEHCEFAITSEIAHRSLKNKKSINKKYSFEKSKRVYMYEKGSVIINPSNELIENIKSQKNLTKIGYNTISKEQKWKQNFIK